MDRMLTHTLTHLTCFNTRTEMYPVPQRAETAGESERMLGRWMKERRHLRSVCDVQYNCTHKDTAAKRIPLFDSTGMRSLSPRKCAGPQARWSGSVGGRTKWMRQTSQPPSMAA